MNKQKFDDFVHRLNTQDNRATAHPLWEVRDKERLYGVEEDYHNIAGYIWYCTTSGEGYESLEEINDTYEIGHKLNPDDDEDFVLENGLEFEKRYYTMQEVTKGVHFTEKAAEDHIKQNHYHYHDPFVYVNSQWRCDEWNDIIGMLKNGQLILKDKL